MYKKLNKSYKTKPKHRRLKRKSLKKKWMKWIGGSQDGGDDDNEDNDDFPGVEQSVRKPDVILKDLQQEDKNGKKLRDAFNALLEKKEEMDEKNYEEDMDKLMSDATAIKDKVEQLVEEMEDPRVGATADQLQEAKWIQEIADKIVKIGADTRLKPAEVVGQPTSFDNLNLKPAQVVSSTSPLRSDDYGTPAQPAAAAAASTSESTPFTEPAAAAAASTSATTPFTEPAEPATAAAASTTPFTEPAEPAKPATATSTTISSQFQQIQNADVLINTFQKVINEIEETNTTGPNKDTFMKPIVEVISHLEKIQEILGSNVSRRDKVKQIAALKSYEKCGRLSSMADSGKMSAFEPSLVKRYRDSCDKMQEYVGEVLEQLNKPEPKAEAQPAPEPVQASAQAEPELEPEPVQAAAQPTTETAEAEPEPAASSIPESKTLEPIPAPASVQPKDESDAVEAVPVPVAQAVQTADPESVQASAQAETASTSMQLTLNPQEMIQMLDGYKNKISELQSKLQKISQDGDVSINIKQGATDMSAETKEMMNNLLPFLALF